MSHTERARLILAGYCALAPVPGARVVERLRTIASPNRVTLDSGLSIAQSPLYGSRVVPDDEPGAPDLTWLERLELPARVLSADWLLAERDVFLQASAQAARERAGGGDQVVALAIEVESVAALADETRHDIYRDEQAAGEDPESGCIPQLGLALERGEAPPADWPVLGWDVLAWDWCTIHGWLSFHAWWQRPPWAHRVALNSFGLLQSEAQAAGIAEEARTARWPGGSPWSVAALLAPAAVAPRVAAVSPGG